MSGIYIKDMEMPTSCYDCNCFIRDSDGGDYCCLLMIDIGNNNKRDNDCPLVPVPPHGRLIDADALVEILLKVIDINASIEQRNEATEQERRCLWWFEQQIGIAPTIIPAEEED